MRYRFISPCSPCANGRKPQEGDVAHPITIPTDDGGIVEIELGRTGLAKLCVCFAAMLLADPALRKEVEKIKLDTDREKRKKR